MTKKEIKDMEIFMSENKSNEELIDIIGSCRYDTGEWYGRLKGEVNALESTSSKVLDLLLKKKMSDKDAIWFINKFLKAGEEAHKFPHPKTEKILKDSRTMEKVARKILKQRKVI